MSEYKCDICDKQFAYFKNLKYHKEQNVCNPSEKQSNDKNVKCRLCDKQFTTMTSMYRHMRTTCIVKKKEDKAKNDIFERLVEIEEKYKEIKEENKEIKEENKELKQKVKKIEKSTKTTNNINNGTINAPINNGIINTNQIILVGYGHEDMKKFKIEDIVKALNGFNTPLNLTQLIHFNPEYPEYHNIYIPNMRDKYAMKYDDKCEQWELMDTKELIDKIYENKRDYIDENLDDFINSLSPSRRAALNRWLTIDDEHDKVKEVKESIKLFLYNKRNIPLDTRQIIRQQKIIKNDDKKDEIDNETDESSEIKKIIKRPNKKLKNREKSDI
jgi:hypothetical protein